MNTQDIVNAYGFDLRKPQDLIDYTCIVMEQVATDIVAESGFSSSEFYKELILNETVNVI